MISLRSEQDGFRDEGFVPGDLFVRDDSGQLSFVNSGTGVVLCEFLRRTGGAGGIVIELRRRCCCGGNNVSCELFGTTTDRTG